VELLCSISVYCVVKQIINQTAKMYDDEEEQEDNKGVIPRNTDITMV
jgi:hypothetical protein